MISKFTGAIFVMGVFSLGMGLARAQSPSRPGGGFDSQRGATAGAAVASPLSPLGGSMATAGSSTAGTERTYGSDPRQMNADGRIIGFDGRTIYPPPLEQPLDPEKYQVDKGDVLQARVWGEQNFDISLPVDPDGRLFVPRVGYVMGHGHTLAQVSTEVTQKLQARFPKLHIAVTIAVPRTFLVRVTGAVGNPGMALPANAWTRSSEVIARAGGVGNGGSSRLIELHHADGKVETIDLLRYPLFGDRSQDPVVLDGDWVHVPIASRAVTVNGGVNRPGTYELVEGTFAELLKLAGGFTPEANDHYGLRVASVDGDQRKMHFVEWKHDQPQSITTDLRHHDVVVVPTVDEGARIVVKGAVGQSGSETQRTDPRVADTVAPIREVTVALPYVDGETVRGALLKAGGLAPWADLDNAWVEHTAAAARQANKDNGNTTDGASSTEGKVVQTSAGAERVPINLKALFTMNDRSKDVKLEPGDTIYVPSGRTDVVVSGHVMKPGIYGFSLRLTAADYVEMAGGETRDGARSRAKVVSVDGKSRKLDDALHLQPGDSIVVPGKVLTTAEWVTISLGIVSVGLSAALLGYNLSR